MCRLENDLQLFLHSLFIGEGSKERVIYVPIVKDAVSFSTQWAMVDTSNLTTQIKAVVSPHLSLSSFFYLPNQNYHVPRRRLSHSSVGGSTHRPWSFISWIRASVACSIAIPRFTTVCRTHKTSYQDTLPVNEDKNEV